MMLLSLSRCTLRPWRNGDQMELVREANNPRVARRLRDLFPHPYTRQDADEWIARAARPSPVTDFAIEVEGHIAGGIGLLPGSDVNRVSAEIGYWLGETLWGRGIATEAVVLVTAYTFDQLNLLRMFALPFADNLASRRVLEKAGYECEAILRASSVKFGQPRDQAVYARINPKWRLT